MAERERRLPLFPIQSVAATLVILVAIMGQARAQHAAGQNPDAIRDYLDNRVAANPNDASSWRMLGRTCLQSGDLARAGEALERAIGLDPLSAAAHFDLGSLLQDSNRLSEAAEHYREASRLAPESDYGRQASERLAYLPPAPEHHGGRSLQDNPPEATLASYEIKRFDGTDRVEPPDPAEAALVPSRPLSVRIEGGGLYNTNAALTPTSRNFFAGQASSFQGFLNPDLEYRAFDNGVWRAGPRFTGYFNLNEATFSNLNLQSYQPAFFVDRSIPLDAAVIVPRVQYVFTHDEFQAITFASRHALTASAGTYWDNGDLTLAFLSGDYTNFADDGGDPARSSRDGYTAVAGLSQQWLLDLPRLRTFTFGGDIQYTDAAGSNFTFAGVNLYAEAEVPLAPTWALLFDGSWGYRNYFQSDLVPSRNENLWRGGARLRKTLSDNWSIVGVFTYNRFDSANAFFQADRILTGIVTVFEY